MSVLAALLVALGVADVVGGQLRQQRRTGQLWPVVAGLLTLVLIALLCGLTTAADLGLLALAAVVVAGWELLSAKAFGSSRHYWSPLVVLAAGGVGLVLLSGFASPVAGPAARWLAWADLPGLSGLEPDRVLLILGLFAVQGSTGNVAVRLVLRHVGALRPTGPQPSDRLRGGRLLGPMERVVILGLGLAGQVTGATVVIGAKALIRWPELQKSKAPVGDGPFPGDPDPVSIDEVTEYFLVGSFVSWLIALAAVAFARLG